MEKNDNVQKIIDNILKGKYEDVLNGLQSKVGIIRFNAISSSAKNHVISKEIESLLRKISESNITIFGYSEGEFALAALYLLGCKIDESAINENVQNLINYGFKDF